MEKKNYASILFYLSLFDTSFSNQESARRKHGNPKKKWLTKPLVQGGRVTIYFGKPTHNFFSILPINELIFNFHFRVYSRCEKMFSTLKSLKIKLIYAPSRATLTVSPTHR